MAKHRQVATRPPPTEDRPKNRILAALPEADYSHLLPHLTTIPMRAKQVVQHEGEPLEYVYFPNGGVFSITTLLPDGRMVEAATIGDEGMVGLEAYFLAAPVAPGRTLLQVPDTSAVRLRADAFRRDIAQRGALHDLIGRYAQTVVAQMMQSAACNALHPVHQRCARWLLMTHDRMHLQDFHLSHEFLAVMLGVHRPTVTLVAGALQQKKLISYTHGRVRVLNRKGLERASCSCYAVIRGYFDRMHQ
jgi:CRP-like cAMP-binding protein